MPTHDEQITKKLDQFEKARDLDALRNAGRLVESRLVASGAATGDPHSRQSKLELWLAVLDRIDRKLDRRFDPDDLPSITSEPPPELGLPAGVDPAAIKDPAARKQYEAAMEADRRKREEYDFQSELHQINNDLTGRFGKFIAADCGKPEGEKQIRVSIESIIKNGDRRQELNKMIEALK